MVVLKSYEADTAKLTGPRTLADKKWIGPVKLLYIIIFDNSKMRPKSIFGPAEAQKFSRCLYEAVTAMADTLVAPPINER